MWKKIYLILIGLIFVHLFILCKLQFTAWPEMVSFPYLINQGFVTYKDMIHAYPPLLVNILAALYKIFGYNVFVLKAVGWIGFVFNDVLIFVIIKRLVRKENLALMGVFVYVILQSLLDGNMVWPDLFIIPFLLLTFLFLIQKKYFFSGLAIGLAILTKQTGILFLGVSGIYLIIFERKGRNVLRFILGISIIVLPFVMSLIKQNTLGDFLNWTFIYPSKYWTNFPGYVQIIPTLRENLILLVLILPLALFVYKSNKKIFFDKYFLLMFGFLVFGIIGVYPRFSFFHLQPAIAFLIITYFYLAKDMHKQVVYGLLFIPVFVLILNFKSLQFNNTRFWTSEDIKLGQIIERDTLKDKPVYLLGLNSNLYALADRIPNKPWLDNFGWYLEIPRVQESVVKSFEKDPPSAIFWAVPNSGNWYDIGTYQPKMISDYIMKNYTKVKEVKEGIWEWERN